MLSLSQILLGVDMDESVIGTLANWRGKAQRDLRPTCEPAVAKRMQPSSLIPSKGKTGVVRRVKTVQCVL